MSEPLTTAQAVGDAIIALPQHPMDRSTSEILLRLSIMDSAGGFSFLSDKPLPSAVKIMTSRLQYGGLTATDSVILMISALCDRPGTIILYCAAIKAIAVKTGRQPVTLDDLVQAFDMGFPNDDDLGTIWDCQKVRDGSSGSDNWLDRAEAWQ